MLGLLELVFLVFILQLLIGAAFWALFRYLGLTAITVNDTVTNRRALDAEKRTRRKSKN